MNEKFLIITTSSVLSQHIRAYLDNEINVFSIHEWLPLFEKVNKGQLLKSRAEKELNQDKHWIDLQSKIAKADSVIFLIPPGMFEHACVQLFAELQHLSRFYVHGLRTVSRKTVRAALKKKNVSKNPIHEKIKLFTQIDQLFMLAQKQHLSRSKKLSVAAARGLNYLYENMMQNSATPDPNYQILADICDDTTSEYIGELKTINDEPPVLPDKNYVKAVIIDLKPREFYMKQRIKKTRSLSAPLPMNSSRLVRHAYARHGYLPAEALEIARSLYEGVLFGKKYPESLITWPFTNSLTIPEQDVTEAREFILNHVGVDYLPQRPVSSKGTDPLGAIRPIHVHKQPRQLKKYVSSKQLDIYTLIWEYFVASHMVPAKIQNQQIDISAGTDDRYLFQIFQERIRSRGFLQLSANFFRESTNWSKWRKGTHLALKELRLSKPIKQSHHGVSRAELVQTLVDDNFPAEICVRAVQELLDSKLCTYHHESGLELTTSGTKYRNLLKSGLDVILQPGFTKRLVINLEKIESGKQKAADILSDYEKLFVQAPRTAVARPFNKKCPECAGALVSEKDSTHCENFPYSCHYYYKKSDDLAPVRRCKECGSEMIEKNGPYGRFMACSAFPKCRHSEPFALEVQCPKSGCPGMIVERRTKNGALFYGCSRYPECRFSSWQQPVNTACPSCGSLYMLLQPGDTDYMKCPVCKKTFHADLSPKNG